MIGIIKKICSREECRKSFITIGNYCGYTNRRSDKITSCLCPDCTKLVIKGKLKRCWIHTDDALTECPRVYTEKELIAYLL